MGQGLLLPSAAPLDHGCVPGGTEGPGFNSSLFFTSASLRIPGSNSTIGEKLEKYNSAVQVPKALGRAGRGGRDVGRHRGVAWSPVGREGPELQQVQS